MKRVKIQKKWLYLIILLIIFFGCLISLEILNKKDLVWGVSMHPMGITKKYNKVMWAQELKMAKELGVSCVRIKWDFTAAGFNPKAQIGYHNQFLKPVIEQDLNIYLIFEPDKELNEIKDPYNEAYGLVYNIVDHYKGRIKYYQILNEAGRIALKGGDYPGDTDSNIDDAKFKIEEEWLKGASDAIRKADPSAKIVINGMWLNTAFFDRIEKDKISYDIIAWDWFSDMGLMGNQKMSDGSTLLINKLKSYGKPIMLAEVNQRPEGDNGSRGMDQDKQANYIAKMAKWAQKERLSGFFIYALTDLPNNTLGYVDRYGLVSADKNMDGTYSLGNKLKAFYTYSSIIKKYSK